MKQLYKKKTCFEVLNSTFSQKMFGCSLLFLQRTREGTRMIRISRFSGGKAGTLTLESVDTRSPGPLVNSCAEHPSVVLERTKAGERDEGSGLRQGAEQADKAALHPAEGSSEL